MAANTITTTQQFTQMSASEYESSVDPSEKLGTYEGERNDANQRHGQGSAVLPNKDEFTGVYENGKRSEGKYTFVSGSSYNGEYRNNLRDGQGVFEDTKGNEFNGEWKNGVKEGQGEYTYSNGDKYQGEWKNGNKDGQGKYVYASTGAVYEGGWKKGKRSGYGSLDLGYTVFKGTFVNDQPSGDGVYEFVDNGTMQKGVFVNGVWMGEDVVKM
eukprot:TRINITY_DN3008_c0_g1_i4.p1 TRINITY_DN3008_c0_g1~~TRINITY_DN3008_c0_g1_i4.p1  ORF type:complete len:213 (-),score=55.38 TRINITY_DN3008_c0_g1_i4:21-659(-)